MNQINWDVNTIVERKTLGDAGLLIYLLSERVMFGERITNNKWAVDLSPEIAKIQTALLASATKLIKVDE